ncbi:MAG: hypothetical protein Q8Q25_01525 [bacterium]|nr:hypothetical protein [bacterium]
MLAKARLITTLSIIVAVSFYMHKSSRLIPATDRPNTHQITQINDLPSVAIVDTYEALSTQAMPQPNREPIIEQKVSPVQKELPLKKHTSSQASTESIPTSIETTTQTPYQRIVTIKNEITEKMIGYKHWSGTYKPSTFVLKINDIRIDPGTEKAIAVTDDVLNVRYDYSFKNGYHTGAKKVTFELDKKTKIASVTFSWKNKWHVIIDTAIPKSIQIVAFDA